MYSKYNSNCFYELPNKKCMRELVCFNFDINNARKSLSEEKKC